MDVPKLLIVKEQIAIYEEFLEQADNALFNLYKTKDDLEQGSKTT